MIGQFNDEFGIVSLTIVWLVECQVSVYARQAEGELQAYSFIVVWPDDTIVAAAVCSFP